MLTLIHSKLLNQNKNKILSKNNKNKFNRKIANFLALSSFSTLNLSRISDFKILSSCHSLNVECLSCLSDHLVFGRDFCRALEPGLIFKQVRQLFYALMVELLWASCFHAFWIMDSTWLQQRADGFLGHKKAWILFLTLGDSGLDKDRLSNICKFRPLPKVNQMTHNWKKLCFNLLQHLYIN